MHDTGTSSIVYVRYWYYQYCNITILVFLVLYSVTILVFEFILFCGTAIFEVFLVPVNNEIKCSTKCTFYTVILLEIHTSKQTTETTCSQHAQCNLILRTDKCLQFSKNDVITRLISATLSRLDSTGKNIHSYYSIKLSN
jgi:hypothetical protein